MRSIARESIRTAVVGAGQVARQHIACLRTIPGAEVVAVCDISRVKAERAAEQFQIPRWFTDYSAMLAQSRPHVVHITSPPASHFQLALLALEAGAHAFVEKPITLRYEDFLDLKRRAIERDLFLIEDHNYLYNPLVRRVLEKAATGDLGDIVGVDIFFCVALLGAGSPFTAAGAAHPALALPGGPIYDFLPHMAYLANAFVGNHVQVHANWERGSAGALPNDEFRAFVRCSRGIATLAFSARAQPNLFSVTVHGTRARARLNLLEPLLLLERVGTGRPALAIAANGLAQARDQLRAALAGLWGRLGDAPGPYEGMWELVRRTYAALRRGEPQPVPMHDIDATQRLLADLVPR